MESLLLIVTLCVLLTSTILARVSSHDMVLHLIHSIIRNGKPPYITRLVYKCFFSFYMNQYGVGDIPSDLVDAWRLYIINLPRQPRSRYEDELWVRLRQRYILEGLIVAEWPPKSPASQTRLLQILRSNRGDDIIRATLETIYSI